MLSRKSATKKNASVTADKIFTSLQSIWHKEAEAIFSGKLQASQNPYTVLHRRRAIQETGIYKWQHPVFRIWGLMPVILMTQNNTTINRKKV